MSNSDTLMNGTSPVNVPYAAYTSKRHSKNLSAVGAFATEPKPPVAASPPPSEPTTPVKLGSNSIRPPIPSFLSPSSSPPSQPVQARSDVKVDSSAAPLTHPPVVSPPIYNEPPPPVSDETIETSAQEGVPSIAVIAPTSTSPVVSIPPADSPSTSQPPPSALSSNPPAANPPASAPASTSSFEPMSPTAARQSSTFRRVPLRGAKSSAPSPLRPASTHSRTFSASDASTIGPAQTFSRPAETRVVSSPSMPRVLRGSAPATPTLRASSPLAQPPVIMEGVSSNFAPPPPSTASSHLALPHGSPASGSRSPSPSLGQSSNSKPDHAPQQGASSNNGLNSPNLTPNILPSPPMTPSSPAPVFRHGPAPYRPGFQPKGVYRPRTDEFIAARAAHYEARRPEELRLQRRLEKLIDLHFSPETTTPVTPAQPRRASSFFDFDLGDLKGKSPGDLWRGVLESKGTSGSKTDIRAAEQAITPWQEDSSVSACPLCKTSFHPITNRKHHCRLCGKIICSLPPKAPNRIRPCSILIVADWKTKKIREVEDVIAYGVSRKTDGSAGQSEKEKEAYLKGVRIDRECAEVVFRQQYTKEISTPSSFVRLHEALMRLEKELEDSLPEFQELLVNYASPDNPANRQAASARKHLLEAFADYDALAKRIRKLPCTAGSSQDRLQQAILTRANLFLQKNMFPLQRLPKPKKHTRNTSSVSTIVRPDSPGTPEVIDPDSSLAHQLQPLLEQEALVESFIQEANESRKFEDAKILRQNLEEIRMEIQKMTVGAKLGVVQSGKGV